MQLNTLMLIALVAGGFLVTAKAEDVFVSEAKLLVRWVVEQPEAEQGEKAPDAVAIVNDVVAELRSPELLRSVAIVVGPEKLLGHANPVDEGQAKAAAVIQEGFHVKTRKGSTVMSLSFQHTDSAITQQVLDQLMKAGFERILRIRQADLDRPNGADAKKNRNELALVNLSVVQRPSEPRRIKSNRLSRLLPKLEKQKAEQGGADQPATAPESKLKGKDKPKPESEVRPR